MPGPDYAGDASNSGSFLGIGKQLSLGNPGGNTGIGQTAAPTLPSASNGGFGDFLKNTGGVALTGVNTFLDIYRSQVAAQPNVPTQPVPTFQPLAKNDPIPIAGGLKISTPVLVMVGVGFVAIMILLRK